MFGTLKGLIGYHSNLLEGKTEKEKLYIKKVVKKTMVEDLEYVSFKLYINKKTMYRFITEIGSQPPDIFDLPLVLMDDSKEFFNTTIKADYESLELDISSWNLVCINKSFLHNERPYIKIRVTYRESTQYTVKT